eukprot:3716302-Amphidinium_carterae.1
MQLLSVHERSLNMVLDRMSHVVVIYSEAIKTELLQLCNAWRKRDPARIDKESFQKKQAAEAEEKKKKEAAAKDQE